MWSNLFIIQTSEVNFEDKKSCTWRVLCWRAQPGFEPGTSRTRSENHTTRPSSQVNTMDSLCMQIFASTYEGRLGRGVDQNEFEAVAHFQGLRRSLGCLSCSCMRRHLLPLRRHPTFLRLITRLPAHPAHHCTVPNPPATSSFPTALFPCPFLCLCDVSRRLFASPPAESSSPAFGVPREIRPCAHHGCRTHHFAV